MTPTRIALLARALLLALVVPLTVAACSTAVDATIDDATITARVKTAILNDPQIGAMKIDVETTRGVVTLSGIVDSQADASRAIQLATQAAGANDVKSTLQIKP